MLYRIFGKTGFRVSALGFGCMRLPLKDPEDAGSIDEAEAIRMIRFAVDEGVNYIDTAYTYHKQKSESLVGSALAGGYREKVKIATKLPIWEINKREDCDRILEEQLNKLKTDHVDMYLLHSLNQGNWAKVKELDILSFLDQALEDGRIKQAGFSFHDDNKLFKEIIDAYNWDFCQIQLNIVDQDYQAGLEGMRYAKARGIAVVVMEPLRGGKLVKKIPPEIEALWRKAPVKRSPVAWGLRWVWNQPEVSLLLSGMSSMAQLAENIRIAENSLPLSLTQEELDLIEGVRREYDQKMKIKCTSCGYCLPCPRGVSIPDNLAIYNDLFAFGSKEDAKRSYLWQASLKRDASLCIGCGSCEKVCPQGLPISQYLEEMHQLLKEA